MTRQLILCLLLLNTGAFAQTTFFVAPHVVDTGYAAAQDSNYVAINTAVASNGKLLLFLDGSGSNTKDYTYFPKLAANMGYSCISVAYPNSPTIGSLCSPSSDSLCYDKVHQEICYGTDASTLVSVDTFNSICTRTVKLLQYLAANYPLQNWATFLSGGAPVWSRIVVAGHSQGSGHALYFAKTNACYRLIMFAGADDYGAYYNRPAHWIYNTSLTPVSSYYQFLHLQDDVEPYTNEYAIARALGMTATGDDSTIADNKTIPYLNSHCLYSNATPDHPGIYSSYHDAPVVDFFTPLSGSSYLYDSVWYYTLAITTTGTATGANSRANALRIYPNPANDILHIFIPATGNSNEQTYTITNTTGSALMTGTLQPGNNTIPVAALPAGYYLVRVSFGDGEQAFCSLIRQ